MKKRVLAVLLCGVFAMSTLTACGSEEAAPAAEETTEEVDVEEEAEEEEVTEGCSDDTFSALQDTFAALKEVYDLVENYYLENEDIPQDDDVEEALGMAKDYLDEVGEIEQTEITDADAVELAKSMQQVADGLEQIAQGLDLMAEAGAAQGEMCSDESFAALQDCYASLVELNNVVTDYYLNNDAVAQDDDIEETLNLAQQYIDQVGEIEQSSITEEDALTLVNSMNDVVDGLSMIADAMN